MKAGIVLVVFACLTSAYSHPTPNRVKRGSSSASASASSSSGDFGLDDDSEGFGFGTGTRLNPFFPWGAFAGTYQPGTGRSGSGCAGFGCGVQFGDFFPSFGQLFNNYDGGFSAEQAREFTYSRNGFPANYNYNDNYYGQYSPEFQNYNNPYPNNYNNYQYAPPTFRSPYYPGPGDFARMGGGNSGSGGQIYFPPGSSVSSSSSSSSNGNGVGYTNTYSNVNGITSRISSTRDSSGRVTTVQGGSGVPDSISTRVLKPGQSGGIYSSSGVQQQPNGQVSSYQRAGQY